MKAASAKKATATKPSVKPAKLEELSVRKHPKGGRRGGGDCDEFGCGMNHNEVFQDGGTAMKATASRKTKPSRRSIKVKDLSPRKDLKGGVAPPKIAINHNEVLVAEGTWID
jgi:hypothetical protein